MIDPRDAFDAALIPGMRQRLAEGYARFRAAEAKEVDRNAPTAMTPRTDVYRERDCPNCYAPPPAHPLLSAHGLDLVTCPVCRLTYSLQIMDETADAERYVASELDNETMRLHTSSPYLEMEIARAEYYLRKIAETGAASGTLLEIGCGTGTFLVAAQASGWQAMGIEPGAAASAIARSRGNEVVVGHFPQNLPAEKRLFDAVAVLDVLEHFADPRAFLHAVRSHISESGRLFVQVPNWDSLLVQLEGAASSVVCPGHWSYFTPASLPDLMTRAGFRTLLVETVVSEIDRIAEFSPSARIAALKKLRPAAAAVNLLNGAMPSAAEIHALGLGYKLIGIFEPV